MQYTLDNFTEWSPSLNGASESTLERQLDMFVEILQAQAGGPRGHRLRRIMLTNYWLYGLQEFEIPHGRLFLAGENASGKSTVLTAALPLALDVTFALIDSIRSAVANGTWSTMCWAAANRPHPLA